MGWHRVTSIFLLIDGSDELLMYVDYILARGYLCIKHPFIFSGLFYARNNNLCVQDSCIALSMLKMSDNGLLFFFSVGGEGEPIHRWVGKCATPGEPFILTNTASRHEEYTSLRLSEQTSN